MKAKGKSKKDQKPAAPVNAKKDKLDRKFYEAEMNRLQTELVKLQAWVRHKGLRVAVLFEGRDAAGKGGVIKRIAERVSPRVFRTVALPAPSDRERTQLYIQRYVKFMPAAGEVVLFDRSWYNRLLVEQVMGFCTDDEYERFKRNCAGFEQSLIEDGIILVKYWLEVGNGEQKRRFQRRIEDPIRQWKLSPMDLESRRRWYAYSRARDAMFAATDTRIAPWVIVPSDDKRRARLNCIRHLLDTVPYEEVQQKPVDLPPRDKQDAYDDLKSIMGRRQVPAYY
ncbi:polyphosphate kinase 2 [Desulfosarcina ovata]|uniref:ADP/GDP-polyphosphate phosphotransferase n=2 Tax=Desulfosarcina ovata TaxID=83564 RepID=A0A5K8AHN5_9BACT|nr:polyphosphate kinase 2 [Desulfosarcina ovata]BBO82523.1 polyphosphate kinase 2 [Desulfosarcina ovata subsp. sediminis]BBO91999.1 polyphosphate kinase 2 [Desulfosarcina ovata subsp. ovata]